MVSRRKRLVRKMLLRRRQMTNLETTRKTVALAAVADAVHVSYFRFTRAFNQSTRVSPNGYMIEQ